MGPPRPGLDHANLNCVQVWTSCDAVDKRSQHWMSTLALSADIVSNSRRHCQQRLQTDMRQFPRFRAQTATSAQGLIILRHISVQNQLPRSALPRWRAHRRVQSASRECYGQSVLAGKSGCVMSKGYYHQHSISSTCKSVPEVSSDSHNY